MKMFQYPTINSSTRLHRMISNLALKYMIHIQMDKGGINYLSDFDTNHSNKGLTGYLVR
jgi:hypothetical protein